MLMNQRSSSEKSELSGAISNGGFYHIEVRNQKEFKRFRIQDVGEKGGIERVGGQREDGSWDTVKWLVSKQLAHVENNKLIADCPYAKEIFDKLGAEPQHISGDRFEAKV